jgi:myosin-1
MKLNARGRCGVDDFVLLEAYDDEDAFIENLRIRHESNIIYVKISLISIK